MKILIGGDVCPINSNEKLFSQGSDELFGELQCYFNDADFSVVNLEAPVTSCKNGILKSGKNIKALPGVLKALKKSHINLLSLANNHIGDFGEQGVIDTIQECVSCDLEYFGAGRNLQEAQLPYVSENGIKVGYLSFADMEFGIATNVKAGSNPFVITDAVSQILKLRESVDYLIVLLHDGKEHYPYPSPELQKICRFLISIGVNTVVCQHSHIIGAWEEFEGGNIFYGQGNLLFDFDNRNSDDWKSGYLIEITIDNSRDSIRLIPFKQSFPGITNLSSIEETQFFENMLIMKDRVKQPDFILESWFQYISKFSLSYDSIFLGHGKLLRKINAYFPFSRFFYNKIGRAYLLNIVRSRVHREIVLNLLSAKVN